MRVCFLLVVCLALACKFNPHVPDGVVTCTEDRHCPDGLSCTRASGQAMGLCCRGGACRPHAGERPPAADATSAPAPGDAAPAGDAGLGGGDAEITLPPAPPGGGTAPTAAADAGAPEAPAADAGSGAALTCSPGADTPPPPAPDRQTHCTLSLGDRWLVLGIDVVTANDPVSTRAHAVCWTEPKLLAATSDGAAARALPPAALDELVTTIRLLQARCTTVKGQPTGAVAGSWARRVPNRAAILDRLRQDTGVTLEIPSEVQELAHRYLGATRNRRGRIVFSDWAANADVMFWPPGASAPTRHIVPVSFLEAASQYFGSTSYAAFEDARRALRGRLQTELAPLTDELARLIRNGALLPGVTVGPTDPTVVLALKGGLREPERGWDPPETYRRKRDEATVTTSPYGRAYGLVVAAELDAFFPSINPRDFMQLRSEPIRSAYGGHVMLTSILLDILADEGRSTEFAFVFTAAHFGYLFDKLAARNP